MGFAERQAAVEDDVAVWVERVGADECGDQVRAGERAGSGGDTVLVPLEGELREDFGREGIGSGVAPEDEVVAADVFGGDFRGFAGAEVAAHEPFPSVGLVGDFVLGPCFHFFAGAGLVREDEEKGGREGIVDGTLEAGFLAERRSFGIGSGVPAATVVGKENGLGSAASGE